ncbi:MAG: CDP-diacylglycerol--serine O-phosphatidyltransferase [Sulfitobacter sp.]|jgi:CDP-diacylglycerol---serine O-phosphatidyltransferase
MNDLPEKTTGDFSLVQLIPNMLTIAAICAGMSAIRYGVQGNFVFAVQLIVVAGVLDGLDGRLARLLGSDSKMGAELDSLADFLNFGVAPPLVLYFWALQEIRAAWISVLVFAVCCVVRLARFNVASKAEADQPPSPHFTGVPSPAGALLVLLPMFATFAFPNTLDLPEILICAYMVGIGLLLISRVPTWSFKAIKVSRAYVKYCLVAVAVLVAALLNYVWITLVIFCLAYMCIVFWSLGTGRVPNFRFKK